MFELSFFEPLPKQWDIVYCHFPDRKRLPSKDNKFSHFLATALISYEDPHYCLVLDSYEETQEVMVVYGTSKNTTEKEIKNNEFLLKSEKIHLTGLTKPTKWIFSADNIAILPYNKKFFTNYRNNSPYVGCFPTSEKQNIEKIILHDSILNIQNDLYDCGYALLSKGCWNLTKYKII